jgi:AraC-like DNA-binding protein
MRLSDPNLSIHQIAAEHRISPRYLQKLFESAGESFSQFVKFRRLERCRLDLGSPLHAQRSISEILYQWGFNDSASFSRAFRERYAMSPREYRKVGALPEDMGEAPRRGRPSAQKEGRPEEREDSAAPPLAKGSAMLKGWWTGWSRTCRSMPRAACATMPCRSVPTRSTGAISARPSSPRSKSARATM